MRRAVGFGILGIAAYAAFLVATVPAALVAPSAEGASRGLLRLAEVRGTAWRGESRARLATPAGGTVELDRVTWRWRPGALAAGRIAFEVAFEGPGLTGRGTVARGLSAWHAQEATIEADAAVLAAGIPLLAPWKPQGALRATVPALAFDGQDLRGEATVEWREAAVALSPVRPLGTYRLHATASGSPGQLALSTVSGPLRLAGEGRFDALRSMQLGGTARAEGAEAAALEPLLDLLGARRPDGSRTLALRAP